MARNRAAVYARFSSHNQRSESIEIQLEKAREYCEENGLVVVHEYCDYAQTGRNADRAQFQAMMSDARRGLFDYVVIYKVTRIMRNRDEMSLARIMLRKAGVEILYAGEDISNGSSGVLQLGMLEVLAEYESALDSERIRDGIRKNAERCMANGVRLYGWDIGEDGRYVLNDHEASVLRRMRDMLFAGASVAEIRRSFAGERGKRGHRMTHGGIVKILRRVQNCGTYCYAGVVREGGMPAIWSREDQAAVDKILGDKRRPRRITVTDDYPLTGKLYCAGCGEPMTGTSGTSKNGLAYHYYRCRKCRRSVRADLVERRVSECAAKELGRASVRETIADLMCESDENMSAERQSEAISKELREVDRACARVWDAIESGLPIPGGMERVESLSERRSFLEEELAVARRLESVSPDRDRVMFWLESVAETSDERKMIRMFVSSVVFDGEDVHVRFAFDEKGEHQPRCSPSSPMVELGTIRKNMKPQVYAVRAPLGFVIVAPLSTSAPAPDRSGSDSRCRSC